MPDDIVRAVCEMAQAFTARGDASMVDLLRQSGYLQDPDGVDEPAIERHLRRGPGLVDSWVRYSADQRGSPAWYMLAPDAPDGPWTVGHLSAAGTHSERRRFDDRVGACAFYVKRVAESLRARPQESR